jgi:hypothetical protein
MQKVFGRPIIGGFFVLANLYLFAGCSHSQTMTGQIRVIGNMPFAQLVFDANDGQSYWLEGKKSYLDSLQNYMTYRPVQIHGKVSKKTINGKETQVLRFKCDS